MTDKQCGYRTGLGVYAQRCPNPSTITVDTYRVLHVCEEHYEAALALARLLAGPNPY